jgi:hypothetical protein
MSCGCGVTFLPRGSAQTAVRRLLDQIDPEFQKASLKTNHFPAAPDQVIRQ